MKLYGYTTVFRYVYENESIENFYYFCTDEYMPSDKEADEIKEDLEIGNNDTFEMFGHTANDFNGDDYLSDRLISALTVEDTPKEYVDLQLADITPQKEQAYKLYKEGNSYRKISKMTSVSDKTVKSWVDDYMAYYNAKVDNSLEKNKSIRR